MKSLSHARDMVTIISAHTRPSRHVSLRRGQRARQGPRRVCGAALRRHRHVAERPAHRWSTPAARITCTRCSLSARSGSARSERTSKCATPSTDSTAQWRATTAARRPHERQRAAVLTGARKVLDAAGHAWHADFADVNLSSGNIKSRGRPRCAPLRLVVVAPQQLTQV